MSTSSQTQTDIYAQGPQQPQPEQLPQQQPASTTASTPNNRPIIRRRDGSRVIRITDDQGTSSRRVAKLVGLQGIRSSAKPRMDSNMLYHAVASFLASKHFNQRLGSILPQLPTALQECDFYWDYEYRDGRGSGLEATRQLLQSIDEAWEVQEHWDSKLPELYAVANTTTPGNTVITITGFQDGDPATMEEDAATVATIMKTDTPGSTVISITFDDATSSLSQDENNDNDASATLTRETDNTATLIHEAAKSLEPFAVYGAYWSRVSQIVATVTAGLEIPYITGASTSADLNGMPLLARTVASADGDARAAIMYYASLDVKYVAVVYIQDSWGVNYHASLRKYGEQFGIKVASFAYDVDTLDRTIVSLKQSQYRYIFGIMHDWKVVLQSAYDHDIIARDDYFWMGAEEKQWTGDSFQLDREKESDLAKALHGIGTINLYLEPNDSFDRAMKEMAYDKQLQNEFIAAQAHPEIFDNFTFPHYDPSPLSNTIFDAVLALGLAACSPSSASNYNHTHKLILPDLFTGTEFFDALLQTEFDGVSGHVEFDSVTGSRKAELLQFSVDYVVLSDSRSDDSAYRFESNMVAVIHHDNITHNTAHPFVYHDNTTIPPATLPPMEQDLNLIPQWAQIFGWALAGLVMICSMGWFVWTLRRRKVFAVQVSQPFFLCQLCVGTFVMAAAILPASLPGVSSVYDGDHNTNDHDDGDDFDSSSVGLDVACMSIMWLGFIGFSISFSALASKIWRLTILMKLGFQRAQVTVWEAMRPLYMSLSVNVLMLLCITFASPLQYKRIIKLDNVDEFGRPIDSYGTCRPSDNKFYYFVGVMLTANLIGVFLVTRQSYLIRNIPEAFNDAQSLSLAMMTLVETLILGGPLLLVVYNDSATTLYLVASTLLCVCCLTILFLLFIPKYQNRRHKHRMRSVVMAISRISKDSHESGGDDRNKYRYERPTMQHCGVHRGRSKGGVGKMAITRNDPTSLANH